METAQEIRELLQRQAWWTLDSTMTCDLDTSSIGSLFGWDYPQLFYFGPGADGNGAHDERHGLELLAPKCTESPVSEASTAITSLPTAQDELVMPGELDELLQNWWDADEKCFSSCGGGALQQASGASFQDDRRLDRGTGSARVPTSLDEKALMMPPQAKLPRSSSSHSSGGTRAGDTSGAQRQTVGANCSSKRSATEENEQRGGEGSCKRSRTTATASSSTVVVGGSPVLRPFAVVKPSGADGEVTLADINEWILTPPARPLRHPVGRFACAPRVAAGNRPAPSGKAVAGFTRLRTAGRGTVTIVRTRG